MACCLTTRSRADGYNTGVVRAENGALSISAPFIEIDGSGTFSAKVVNIMSSGSQNSKTSFTGSTSFKADTGTLIESNRVSLGTGSKITAKGDITFISNQFVNDGRIVSNSKIGLTGYSTLLSVDASVTGNGNLEAPDIFIASTAPGMSHTTFYSINQNEIKGTIAGSTFGGLELIVQTGGLQLGSVRNVSSRDISIEAKQHGIFLRQGAQLINQSPGSAISLIASDPATGSISLGKNSYLQASKVNVIVGSFPSAPPVTDFDSIEINISGTTPQNAHIDSSLAVVSKPPANSIIVNGGQVIVSAKGNIRNQVRFRGGVIIKSEFQPVSLNEMLSGTSPLDSERFYCLREQDGLLVYSKSCFSIQIGSVRVEQARDSACLYRGDANCLAVVNLHDSHRDSVQVIVGGKCISLCPGERVVIYKNFQNSGVSSFRSNSLACRFKRDFSWADVSVSLSELSTYSLFSTESLISKLLKDKSAGKIYNRIVKSLLCSSVVRASRGPFLERTF